MPIDALQREVATIALRTAARHGFALAGGNALIAHGIIDRPTDDVDLFSDQESAVTDAAEAVEDALRQAGFEAERRDQAGGLEEIFSGMGEGLAEWIITAPGGQQTMLQMAYFDRTRGPVTMDVGPVLDLEDLAGSKVCALVPLTELTISDCQISGQRLRPVASFRGHGFWGWRKGSGRTGRAPHRRAARNGRRVGALPAA
ncbi:MAG: nucleotidyl transferase AbiEii/AbiGii toxin family protein [Streptosporangiaceae bacterium]